MVPQNVAASKAAGCDAVTCLLVGRALVRVPMQGPVEGYLSGHPAKLPSP